MKETENKEKVCWCNMCGYTAKVKPEDVALFERIETEPACDLCREVNQFSLLSMDDELPEGIDPDDPMPTWPDVD